VQVQWAAAVFFLQAPTTTVLLQPNKVVLFAPQVATQQTSRKIDGSLQVGRYYLDVCDGRMTSSVYSAAACVTLKPLAQEELLRRSQ
jgi:hypothetical protein